MNKHERGTWDRFTEAVVQPDSPAYGDERERAVLTEASTFAMQMGTYLCLAGALLTALFGNLLAPVVLITAGTVPAYCMIGYARRRDVDPYALAARAPLGSIRVAVTFATAALVLTAFAMAYTLWQREGLLPGLPIYEIATPFIGLGMAVGAVGGTLLAILGLRRDRRQAPAAESPDLPDED